MTTALVDEGALTDESGSTFAVRLDNFEGPFDLLLSLIAKHKLDITEVALSQVTDEFIAFIKVAGRDWELEQTSSFLLVASTLLDLKAARLLPQGDVEDEDDLALLEARDLLFARLMQYKAFKQVAGVLEQRMAGEAKRFPRAVGLEERFATLLPEVLIGLGLDELSALAHRALQPKPVQELSLAAHPRPDGERAGAGHAGGRAAAAAGHHDVPGAVRRLPGPADHRRAVPRAARAVPRGRGVVRPDDPDGGAVGALDRCRGRRGRHHRRVRRGTPSLGRSSLSRPLSADDEEDPES